MTVRRISPLLRRGTAADWAASDPILHSGEFGIETAEDGSFVAEKCGDGITSWTGLDYVGSQGSSGGGALSVFDVLFQETPGAGTYVATVDIPAGATVFDILVYALGAPWDADTATLQVGDSAEESGYWNPDQSDFQLHAVTALATPYDNTSVSHENYLHLGNVGWTGPTTPAYLSAIDAGLNASTGGVRYDEADTITCTVVTTGAGGTTGKTLLRFMVVEPSTSIDAVKSV